MKTISLFIFLLIIGSWCYSQDFNFVHHDNLQPVMVGSEKIVTNKLCLSTPTGIEASMENALLEVWLSSGDSSWALLTADNVVQESILVEVENNTCATVKLRFRPNREGDHFTLLNTRCPFAGFGCDNAYRVNAQGVEEAVEEGVEEGVMTPSQGTISAVGRINLDNIQVKEVYFRAHGDELVIDSANGVTHTIDMSTNGEIVPDSVALLPLQNWQFKTTCVTDDNEQFSIAGSGVQLVDGENKPVQQQTFNNLPYSGFISRPDLRLVDDCDRAVSSSEASEKVGRLEILINGRWGTICDDFWSDIDANVACRSLGLSPEGARDIRNCGGGTGPIYLDNINCDGDEESLLDCSHNGIGNHNCGHNEDVGVICGEMTTIPVLVPCTVSEQNVQWFCGENICSFSLPTFRHSAAPLRQNTGYGAALINNPEATAFMKYNLFLQANSTYLELTRLVGNSTDIVGGYITEPGAVLVGTDTRNSRGYVLKSIFDEYHSLIRVTASESDELLVEEDGLDILGLQNPVLLATSEKGAIAIYDEESNTVSIYQEQLFINASSTSTSSSNNVAYYAAVGGVVGGLVLIGTTVFVVVYMACRAKGMSHRESASTAIVGSTEKIAVSLRGEESLPETVPETVHTTALGAVPETVHTTALGAVPETVQTMVPETVPEIVPEIVPEAQGVANTVSEHVVDVPVASKAAAGGWRLWNYMTGKN